MGRIANFFHSIKPPLLMVLVQIIFAGVNVMYKLAANDGMSLRLIVVYRFMFATVIMVPLALIFERLKFNRFLFQFFFYQLFFLKKNFGVLFYRKSLKKINRKVLFQAFLCGLFGYVLTLIYMCVCIYIQKSVCFKLIVKVFNSGSLGQNLYLQSLVHTSATFVAAMINLAPAFTFILAICFKYIS